MPLSPKARTHLSWTLLILAGFAVGYVLLLGEGGYLTLRRHQQELERLKQENIELRQQKQEYGRRIEELKKDPEVIERLVRESDYAHPDDIIVDLPDRKEPQKKTPKS